MTEDDCARTTSRPLVAEFFAGVGLVRLGLESAGFEVVWSNDIESAKHDMYRGHFGRDSSGHTYALEDVAAITGTDLPQDLALAWASFPCTDLSLAGNRSGLDGQHSSTFWHFTRILRELGPHRPRVVALENVIGMATSHGGEDLRAAVRELNELGYSVDLLVLDARRWVPQSRPRLFIVGALSAPQDYPTPNDSIRPAFLDTFFADAGLTTHRAQLPDPPPLRDGGLPEVVAVRGGEGNSWWDADRIARFTSSLSPLNALRIERLASNRRWSYRTAYRRTRNGQAVWEIRNDEIAGCLRTARGGSSKQALVRAGYGEIKVRWLSPREYARLMGAPDYELTNVKPNQAYFGFGDAVCVPAIEWLGRSYLRPLLTGVWPDTEAQLSFDLASAL